LAIISRYETFQDVLHECLVRLEQQSKSTNHNENALLLLEISGLYSEISEYLVIPESQVLHQESDCIDELVADHWHAIGVLDLQQELQAGDKVTLDLIIRYQNSQHGLNDLFILNQLVTNGCYDVIFRGLS
jgi:hypothetical protein